MRLRNRSIGPNGYGQDNSRQKRDIFLEKLGLPKHISVAMLLDVLNTLYRKEEEPFLFE